MQAPALVSLGSGTLVAVARGPNGHVYRSQGGTQSGTKVALDGWGVPRLRSGSRGQLRVELVVQTPTRLDDEQRELLRSLAELRDETSPDVTVQKQGRGVFGRLRDAFADR